MKNIAELSFKPPFGLKNHHLQTMLSSVGLAKIKTKRLRKKLLSKESKIILHCGNGVRLNGIYTPALPTPSSKMITLIHGWEGSVNSSYMVSATDACLQNGIDVFRLNLRDHGDSHHLNKGIFNSTLLPEVIDAVEQIQIQHPNKAHYLGGFSLGGNFALRVAAKSQGRSIQLKKVITFCAALDPYLSNHALGLKHNFIYNQYFTRKWHHSLKIKQRHFPDYQFDKEIKNDIKGINNLDKMNDILIPRYTEFSDLREYFRAYTITEEALKDTICPCHLYFAKDDSIILADDIARLADNPKLNIYISKHGGHCGFIKDWHFNTLQDDLLVEHISA